VVVAVALVPAGACSAVVAVDGREGAAVGADGGVGPLYARRCGGGGSGGSGEGARGRGEGRIGDGDLHGQRVRRCRR